MKPETKQKSKKAFDVISFTLVFLLFICSLLCLIARLNGARFDLFGNRYDVVLTNSMSYKNPEHADFLVNDNNQFQAFDLAISKPLPAPGDLKEHDVVIYTDRYIGTNMHRIVEINEDSCEQVDLTSSQIINDYNGVSGIQLSKVESNIVTNDIQFKTLTLTTYSTLENTDNFNFFAMTELFTPEITRVPVNDIYGGYATTYKITRNTSAPGVIKISHRAIYDYTKEIVTSLQIDSYSGTIYACASTPFKLDGQTGNLFAKFNCEYSYKTRGDAAKDDDGWYKYRELQALVVKNAPGMGYPIRFMGSVWGGLMFALLAILILVVDIIATRMDKKEAAAQAAGQANTTPKVENKPVENKVAKTPEPTPAPKKETTTVVNEQPAPTKIENKQNVSPVTGKSINKNNTTKVPPKGGNK